MGCERGGPFIGTEIELKIKKENEVGLNLP